MAVIVVLSTMTLKGKVDYHNFMYTNTPTHKETIRFITREAEGPFRGKDKCLAESDAWSEVLRRRRSE